MARRKKKEESPEWEPPEFNEIDYMRRDIEGAKAATVTVAWAVVGALIAYGLLIVGLPAGLAFVVGLFSAVGLYYVMPLVGVRVKKFQRKDWAAHGVTYFFSWLAFWILLLNAPVGDFTNPTIHGIAVGSYDASTNPSPGPGTVACTFPTSASVTIAPAGNDTIFMSFRATDNVAVTSLQVRVNGNLVTPGSLEAVAGQAHACSANGGRSYPSGSFVLRIPILGTNFQVEISAQDARGLRADARILILISGS